MARRARPPGPEQLIPTRMVGWLLLAGGVLAAITVVMPPAAQGSELAVVVLGATSAALGAWLALGRRALPEAGLGVVVALGTAMITLATHEGGGPDAGTADNEMLFMWVALFSFYFFTLGHALLQLAAVAVAYALLLAGEVALADAATRMVVTIGTLLAGGVLVAMLRRSRDATMAELAERARNDDLTGLLNRSSLEERAAAELARSRRLRDPLSVLALDIDDFKALNDSLGHLAGDEVLRRIAAALERSARAADAIGRIGGDEFAVLLPGVGAADAAVAATRLRAQIGREVTRAHLSTTVSIGISTSADGSATFDQLWESADAAMYEAKRDGGDSIRAAEGGEERIHASADRTAAKRVPDPPPAELHRPAPRSA